MIKGLSHPKIFDRTTKGSIILSDNNIIGRYLKILLLSSKGEFFSDPNYGCTLSELIYSPNDKILMDLVKDSIVTAIRTYATSIIVLFNDIDITQEESSMNITITYRLSENSSSNKLTLQILNTEVLNG